MTARTVVGWNGSDEAARALDWALRRADRSREPVEILTVVDDEVLGPVLLSRGHLAEQARESLARAEEHARRSHPTVEVSTVLVHGGPVTVLVDRSDSDTLVVLGTRDRGPFPFRYAWSLPAKVAAHAAGPIAVIPEKSVIGRSGIAVGVDGSPLSRAAALFAATEALTRRVPLRVIHAWQEPAVFESMLMLDDTAQAAIAHQHQKILDDEVDRLRIRFPDVLIIGELAYSTPVSALLKATPRADLTVIGNRGNGALTRTVLGSVSQEILMASATPLIILGPHTQTPPDPAAPATDSAISPVSALPFSARP